MNVVGHKNKGIEFHFFFFSAVLKAIPKNMAVFWFGKYINPFHNSESEKIRNAWVC